MSNVQKEYYETIKQAFEMLYIMLKGVKTTHTEVVAKAMKLLEVLLPGSNETNLDAYPEIVDTIVNKFESEVGIPVYEPNILANDKQSTYWLRQMKPNIQHAFFHRYKSYLSNEGFALPVIDNIESTCEKILSYCANPKSQSQVDKKRGLVVGDVQSGKTANYLGLINMAYDYGYKIVVLLAGTTSSLRMQTQKRTDKGVIGAKSDTIGNTIEYIGVGFTPKEHFVVPFTNQSNDFAKFMQKNLNAAISDFNKPVVLVVKKNKSVLQSVSQRLQSTLEEKGLDSKSILIIDDEADNASINTSKPENDPSSINKCITTIFNKFPIATYVGYTATPFANIFIDSSYDTDDNLNLFPADFIFQLNSPGIYFGGRKVFPKGDFVPRCLRKIEESEPDFLPVIHDKYAVFNNIPDSLKEAIQAFLINNVIRTIRGDKSKHRSMMINITRFNDVQTRIWEQVNSYVEKLKCEIEQLSCEDVSHFIANEDMKSIYSQYTTSSFYASIIHGNDEDGIPGITWDEIQRGLYDEIKQFQTIIINSRNGTMNLIEGSGRNKRFDYEEFEDVGARVIAIGGMVLSRGLTLEGLMTSYYSRNATAYDTLLQMCRWFGYRPKYEDLCRVYISQDNIDRFDAVLDAVEDLKQQLSEMERQDKKPKQFGLMVRESPDTLETTLLITQRNKCRGTETIEIRLNYGGVYADTSKLSAERNKYNTNMFNRFLSKIKIEHEPDHKCFMAHEVSKFDVAELIRSLKIPYLNKRFDTEGLSEYIENSTIFPVWDVVIAKGRSKNTNCFGIEGLSATERAFSIKDTLIAIGSGNNRVLDPSDFNCGLWLTPDDKENYLRKKGEEYPDDAPYNSMTAKDYLKLRQIPILVIYPIDLKVEDNETEKTRIKESLENEPLLAFAVGFPNKESSDRFVYRANRVKLDQLIKDIEVCDDEEGEDDDND